jgi:hypothetical protein
MTEEPTGRAARMEEGGLNAATTVICQEVPPLIAEALAAVGIEPSNENVITVLINVLGFAILETTPPENRPEVVKAVVETVELIMDLNQPTPSKEQMQ